jgi:cytochrome c oxidase assembly protein subunit 15
MRTLAVAALLAVIVQGILGGITVLMLLPWWISSSHATLAELFFSTTVAMALFTSRRWLAGPSTVPEDAQNPIRGLSLAAPICVLCQLFLGAMARHKAIGAIYHICGAPFVTGVVLWVSMRILLHYARNPELRTAAVVLITITLTQVFLGVGAFMTRIAYADSPQPMPLMVTFTVLHVAVGALTLAASIVLAILVRRNLGERVAISQPIAA